MKLIKPSYQILPHICGIEAAYKQTEQFTNNLNNKQLEGITKLLKANGNL